MQFKHPELLYALFLLLIPIFIHLFQLRKFQKVDFTNVAFLKKVTLQTRKSSQLKKWLTLLMRLLAFACVILAFAQPFLASKTALNIEKETVLYIDNSFSMQAKGNNGSLLQRTLQDLYKQKIGSDKISWFTNDFTKTHVSSQEFKNDILAVTYSENQLSISEILLKASHLFSNNNQQESSEKRVILISDFQHIQDFPQINKDLKVDVIKLAPLQLNNISIDTAYFSKKNLSSKTELMVHVSAQGSVPENIPISLYNDQSLIAKTALSFPENTSNISSKTISFAIDTKDGFNGKLEINDPTIIFDNSLYFTINKAEKIKVLSLNANNPKYLQRIFNQDEFQYTQQDFKKTNYSQFAEQNFIIVNELKNISESLAIALKSFSENGGTLFIIPAKDSNIEEYNLFFNKLKIGLLSERKEQEKRISKIVFDHPLFTDVFEKKVVNFQYPKATSYFPINTQASAVLKFEDNKPFIIQHKNIYACLAPLNADNSNFQNSPLIVPTIYNMAQQSLPLPKLYFEIGKQNTYAVSVKLMNDEILKIKDSLHSFIPLQQTRANYVKITTTNQPNLAGNYSITKEEGIIKNVSYNYNRKESILQYNNPENWKNVTTYNTIDDLFNSIALENTINNYWKWFVILALLFLILEMIILKFYK